MSSRLFSVAGLRFQKDIGKHPPLGNKRKGYRTRHSGKFFRLVGQTLQRHTAGDSGKGGFRLFPHVRGKNIFDEGLLAVKNREIGHVLVRFQQKAEQRRLFGGKAQIECGALVGRGERDGAVAATPQGRRGHGGGHQYSPKKRAPATSSMAKMMVPKKLLVFQATSSEGRAATR